MEIGLGHKETVGKTVGDNRSTMRRTGWGQLFIREKLQPADP
jgi:hypothetical protein